MSVELRKCARCNLPETYETLEFDSEGICNVCRNHERKATDDWAGKKLELDKLVEQYRGKYDYDCIIPASGGKDSCYALWHMVHHYKIKPLVVRYDHGFLRGGVNKNFERAIKRLGVDSITMNTNWKLVKRTMLEGLIRRGETCWSCHVHIFAMPMHMALKFQVPLVIWGEKSTEYSAYFAPGEEELVDERRFDRFVNLGISAEDMDGMVRDDTDFDYRDLQFASFPKYADLARLGVRSVCLGSYHNWDVKKQVEIIQRELGWQGEEVEGMPEGMWPYEKGECSMQGLRDFIKYLKRGYSRVSQMCALDIRNGRMTTEQARELAKLEGKRPASLPIFLEYMGISEMEFYQMVKATVVPPYEMDISKLETGKPVHDMAQWWREPK